MAGHVSRYAYINAKLRARISTMLAESFFERMEEAYSIGDAFVLLKDTPYAGLSEVYDRTGDLKAVELELLRHEVALYRDLGRQGDESVGELVTAIQLRYEILVLKRALRLWFDRVIRGRSIDDALPYLFRDPICYPIDVDAIVAAGSIDDIASTLHKTPYAELMSGAANTVMTKRTLFPVETGLDRLFFRRLLDVLQRLDRRDSEIASKLVGVQIDIENINRLVRFKEAYHLPQEEILADLIPRGYRLSPKIIDSILASQDAGVRIAEILGGEYPELHAVISGARPSAQLPARLLLIERVLEEVLAIEVRRVLAGYPFTIGVVISYFLLAEAETRRLRSILNAKFYGPPRPTAGAI